MTVNTQELREALAALNAEAGIDAWYDMGDDIYENAPDGVSPIPETDQRFIVQANPATVSALLDEIDALRAELQAWQWQPIETAPKDGTRVLLWIEWSDVPVVGEFSHDRWWADTEHHEVSCGAYCYGGSVSSDKNMKPTHWHPLPLPPDPPQGETA